MNTLSLPLISDSGAPRVFSHEELRQCAEGQCCQCGRCCVLYNVYVPQQNSRGGIYEKLAGEVCPHLAWNAAGRAACGVHSQKNSPALRMCQEYNGKEGNYADVVSMTREMLFEPNSERDLSLLREWSGRGLLSDVLPVSSIAELGKILRQYLVVLGKFDESLFAEMGVFQFLAVMDTRDVPLALQDFGISPQFPQNEAQSSFFKAAGLR